jgi:hypothetical protein
MRHLLVTLAHVFVATIVLVVLSNGLGLGAFGTTTLLGAMGLSAALTVGAAIALFISSAAVVLAFSLEQRGWLLQTVLGTFAGAAALTAVGSFAPDLVMLDFVSALPYAFMNTMLIWGLGITSGTIKPHSFPFWPKRKK